MSTRSRWLDEQELARAQWDFDIHFGTIQSQRAKFPSTSKACNYACTLA
jgi:uncharacterized protein (UPF0128 family)